MNHLNPGLEPAFGASGSTRLPHPDRRLMARRAAAAALATWALLPGIVQAALFKGETLDAVANGAAWVVLFIAPTVAIALFWIVHILPEKIAEKREHPQAQAIKTLCLLSLAFGGMLWPLAWLWAYTKPVLYKLAYGTDRVPHGEAHAHEESAGETGAAAELEQLRQRVRELEGRLARDEAGKA